LSCVFRYDSARINPQGATLSLSEVLGIVVLVAAIGAVMWYYRARD
jgi:hypothetical protein